MIHDKLCCSSQNDVKHVMMMLNLSRDNFQLGHSKVFLRESEKLKLDYKLHQQIISCIVTIQRWFRAHLMAKQFSKLKSAVISIQVSVRWYALVTMYSVSYCRPTAVATW
jgi:myosin heavy subunit